MTLKKLVEEFFNAGREALSSDDAEQLHALRIKAKRLRYTIEILQPTEFEQRVERLKEVQKTLGEMHDAAVAAKFLRDLPALSAEAGVLPMELESESHSKIKQFHVLWREHFSSPRAAEEWIQWARRA